MNDALFQNIVDSRTLVLSGGVSSKMVEEVTQLLTFMEAESSESPIKILINSPGGEAYSGLGLYDTLRYIECPIIAIVNGLCASAGILLLLSAGMGDRYSLPNSRFMIHQPRGGARGTSSDIQIEAREMNVLKKAYFSIIAERCGKEPGEVEADADRDFWIDAAAAMEYGLIGKIITSQSEIAQ